jgi:hypothetical protein
MGQRKRAGFEFKRDCLKKRSALKKSWFTPAHTKKRDAFSHTAHTRFNTRINDSPFSPPTQIERLVNHFRFHHTTHTMQMLQQQRAFAAGRAPVRKTSAQRVVVVKVSSSAHRARRRRVASSPKKALPRGRTARNLARQKLTHNTLRCAGRFGQGHGARVGEFVHLDDCIMQALVARCHCKRRHRTHPTHFSAHQPKLKGARGRRARARLPDGDGL